MGTRFLKQDPPWVHPFVWKSNPHLFSKSEKKPISIRFLQLGPFPHGVTVLSLVCAMTW